jgi:hypothetical protein
MQSYRQKERLCSDLARPQNRNQSPSLGRELPFTFGVMFSETPGKETCIGTGQPSGSRCSSRAARMGKKANLHSKEAITLGFISFWRPLPQRAML